MDLLCMVQRCILFLLIRVPASWLHAGFLLWEMVPLKSGELGLGRLGSPLDSSVGRRPFILNASGFQT